MCFTHSYKMTRNDKNIWILKINTNQFKIYENIFEFSVFVENDMNLYHSTFEPSIQVSQNSGPVSPYSLLI